MSINFGTKYLKLDIMFFQQNLFFLVLHVNIKNKGSTILILVFSFILLSVILVAYVGLIPLGHWQDEYSTIRLFLDDGWGGFLSRLLSWSPRPLSELLVYIYAHLVNKYNQPLITESLSFLWLILIAGVFLVPLSSCRKQTSSILAWQTILLPLALYCLMLVGHPIAEFFYWPQGAVAYIPVVAALCGFFWIFILYGAYNLFTKFLCSGLLILSALSAEVGAILVVVFSSIVFVWLTLNNYNNNKRCIDVPIWLMYPFFISIIILLLMFLGRYESDKEMFGDVNIAHHILSSLYQSITDYIVEFLSVDAQHLTINYFVLGFTSKVLFFYASFKILSILIIRFDVKERLTYLLQFGIACFLTSYLTIVAAYYQFGLKCCERHLTFRQCLIYIGLISIAAFFAGRVKEHEVYKDISNVSVVTLLLLTSVLLPASVSLGGVIYTYKNYGKYVSVNNVNWNNGVSSNEYFVYCLLPPDRIIGGINVANGEYNVNDASGWFVHSIINFFDKKSIIFKNNVNCVE